VDYNFDTSFHLSPLLTERRICLKKHFALTSYNWSIIWQRYEQELGLMLP